jgi:hypothetical protein
MYNPPLSDQYQARHQDPSMACGVFDMNVCGMAQFVIQKASEALLARKFLQGYGSSRQVEVSDIAV